MERDFVEANEKERKNDCRAPVRWRQVNNNQREHNIFQPNYYHSN